MGRVASTRRRDACCRGPTLTDIRYAKLYQGIREFLRLEAAAGIVLGAATVLALVASNSGLADLYDLFLELPVEVRFGAFAISKPLLLWINDGLMALFFLLVGWAGLYGVAVMSGIGFTMSLFIGTLAWDTSECPSRRARGVFVVRRRRFCPRARGLSRRRRRVPGASWLIV